MKVLNFTLNINIDQSQPQSGCFGIYYQMFSSKRCVEDPNAGVPGNPFNDQVEQDAVNDVQLLQGGFLSCETYSSTDTTLVYNGSITYNDNSPMDYLSCRTFIVFYVLPCCTNNWDCNTLPTNMSDPSVMHDIKTNSFYYMMDISSQVNKTLCRRYNIALDSSKTYNYPLTVIYYDCGKANNYLCDGNQVVDPSALVPQQHNIVINSSFGTVSGSIPVGNLGRVIEICSSENPIVVDSTNTIINNQLFIVEDINESKEPITGDCCSKCRTYGIINNETSTITYQYQKCDGSFQISTLAAGSCVCFTAIQGTVRAGDIVQNIAVTEWGWHGKLPTCVSACN